MNDKGCLIIFNETSLQANKFVKFLSGKDKNDCFVYLPDTSNIARLLIERNQIMRKDCKHIMLLTNDTIYLHFDAVIESLQKLGNAWVTVKVLKLLPRRLRNRIY